MKKLQSSTRSWIWLLVLLFVFILISFFIYSQKPKSYPSYVTDSPAPSGVKAFYTYMKHELDGKVWSYSPDILTKEDQNQLLVIVEPFFTPDQKETQAFIDFMKAGNTILLLKNNPMGMFDLKTGPYEDSPATDKDVMEVKDQNQVSYRAEINSAIRFIPTDNDQILLKDAAGTVAIKRNYGKGQLIVAISPDWITNDKLLVHDHLPLILKLVNEAKPESIIIDEFLHTGKSNFAQFMVYPKWFLLLLFQGLLLILLWLWYKGKRFGPLFSPREESIRFSDEGILALTAWYIRGKRYQDSIKIQADYVKQMLQEHWHIPYSKEWKDSMGVLEKKWKQMSRSEIHSFLNGLESLLVKEKISKQEYLLWSRKLERLRKEVDEG
ncbi:hypothetical protein QE429_002678 [Bacillus sp. SORGH_AS 510]|uniref:DUF4350 domain-containing protein n=1 Tax=Bacillus sp. SORGH_AS_0510 TaxID=3041771 RepID=UPI00278AEF3B|nr:DUF4350 domain-containing protein [Bacillus sp. SORGH_AS_0510]MDQ1145851.1 hypothetical protein [Bacillus sp. SORGH_AS_0510]